MTIFLKFYGLLILQIVFASERDFAIPLSGPIEWNGKFYGVVDPRQQPRSIIEPKTFKKLKITDFSPAEINFAQERARLAYHRSLCRQQQAARDQLIQNMFLENGNVPQKRSSLYNQLDFEQIPQYLIESPKVSTEGNFWSPSGAYGYQSLPTVWDTSNVGQYIEELEKMKIGKRSISKEDVLQRILGLPPGIIQQRYRANNLIDDDNHQTFEEFSDNRSQELNNLFSYYLDRFRDLGKREKGQFFRKRYWHKPRARYDQNAFSRFHQKKRSLTGQDFNQVNDFLSHQRFLPHVLYVERKKRGHHWNYIINRPKNDLVTPESHEVSVFKLSDSPGLTPADSDIALGSLVPERNSNYFYQNMIGF